ncbi:CBS domain-containing protein [Oricola thermophila]|uniref:CBS domain-containing protein n=1 Tax=Oricola thermophila TaxID=2742145 RepID=A0A6N1VCX3_9HYPH|nr:CBS domain-containing protein [Oricola thermophila]QKV18558.1 CBS domain-containing protein [Oricola thermophila]
MADRRIDAVMQTEFLRLRRETPIREAVAKMVEAQAHAAPVVDDTGALIGILSQKDCFRPAVHASYYQQWQGTAGEYMNSNVVTLEAETDIVSAAEAFLEKPYRVFPVLRGGRLVGMLERTQLLAVFLQLSNDRQ